MKVNVYFDSLDNETLPVLATIREWRSRSIKIWVSRETYDAVGNRQYILHARDCIDIVDDVHIDQTVCFFEWDVTTFCARQVFSRGTKALLSRPWLDSPVIVGRGSKAKKRLVAFCDAVQRGELPESFIKIPWVNSADQLLEYCQDCGVFAFSLKDKRRFEPTKIVCKGALVYKETDTGYYYCFDTLHCSHYEMFDRDGRHVAEVDLYGIEDKSKADKRKRLVLT